MSKVIKMTLSEKSIQNAIKEIRKYQQEFQTKLETFTTELAKVGIPVINENMEKAAFTVDSNGILSGAETSHTVDTVRVDSSDGKVQVNLVVHGHDVAFIEFGAGVYYNGAKGSSPHPNGEKLGFTIGSYGLGHGARKIWGYYDESGALVLTHGVAATMPIYRAYLELLQQYAAIAKRVFG